MARLYSTENFPIPVVEELRRLGHEGEYAPRVFDELLIEPNGRLCLSPTLRDSRGVQNLVGSGAAIGRREAARLFVPLLRLFPTA